MGFLGGFNFRYREFFLDSLKALGIFSSYFLLWLFSLPSYGFLRLPCRLDLRVFTFRHEKNFKTPKSIPIRRKGSKGS